MNPFEGMSDAEFSAAYKAQKSNKDPFATALAQEGVSGQLADVARSIYQQESSGGRNSKTSNAGAVGGMQIIPSTFASVADKGWDINDPTLNARAGIRYLKQIDQQSGGDPALTAAGYYGGPGGMEKARRGIAVSDPRNPNAPNTLQYGQQVAARLPNRPIVNALNAVTDVVMPSANAATPAAPKTAANPFEGMSDDEFKAAYGKFQGKPFVPQTSIMQDVKQGVGNVAAGLIRGAGSIGETILDRVRGLGAAAQSATPANMRVDNGFNDLPRGNEISKGMDAGLQALGAQPDSLLFKGGKLTGEIAGTAGAGGAVANVAARIPAVAAAAPNLLNAIRTSGMAAGNGGAIANAMTRAAGGAISGGAQAAMVNPDDAAVGAGVGALLPGALQVAGKAGNALGRVLRGPEQAADMVQAVTAARGVGYVIPPTQANPTLGNRLLEGFSGKITTAQNASAKNQLVTNDLAAAALGLAKDTKITPDALTLVRTEAGKAYEAIGATGVITPGKAYTDALDKISAPFIKAAQGFPNAKPSPVLDIVESLKSPSFDAASAISQIKNLRTAADDAFRKGDTDIARASKGAATAIEDAIESHLQLTGNQALLSEFRDARQLIAKSYTVEKALNQTTGSVDARKLAAQLAKGKPLTNELRTAAEFGQRFPKAAQALEGMGSLPQTSPLDWAAAGSMSAATGNPLMMAGTVARPIARYMALSPAVQNRLVQGQGNALSNLVGPNARQLIYQSAPVLAGDR